MIEQIMTKFLKVTHPSRNYSVQKVGNSFFTFSHDSINFLTFSLQGTYCYDEVEKLNKITGNYAQYGYCPGKGPIAIIGLFKPDLKFKYFYDIIEYGTITPKIPYRFDEYSYDQAKKMNHYIVYGCGNFSILKDLVRFNKIHYMFDSRYKIKRAVVPKIINMDCLLYGAYAYSDAVSIADSYDFRLQENSIVFGKLEDNSYVGIIGLDSSMAKYVVGFRDVWEFEKPKPDIQNITFLEKKWAKNISNYKLYIYDLSLPHSFSKGTLFFKLDHTFDPYFDFYLTPSGNDYRLEERLELLGK